MTKSLITPAELAAILRIDESEIEPLRRRHRWAHVKVGRFNVRFTEEQVALIVASHTQGGATPASVGRSGQSARSKARAS